MTLGSKAVAQYLKYVARSQRCPVGQKLMKPGCRMASCEATSLVTKLWMKRAFNARNSSIVSADRSRRASCMLISFILSKRQFAGFLRGGAVRRIEAFDLQFLQRRVGRHRQRREGGKEREPKLALRKLHGHHRRRRGRIARQLPFGRQAGIGHDFVEQLRGDTAALRDLAMQDLDHLAGELVPVHDELPQAL